MLYRKTFEPPYNTNVSVMEDPCIDPVAGGLGFCWWYFVDQYNPPTNCPVITSETALRGSYSLKMSVGTKDVVGSGVSQRCEIGKLRRQDTFTHDYFHVGFKLEDDWDEDAAEGHALDQVGYQWISGTPIGLAADGRSFCCGGVGGRFDAVYVLVNAGSCGGTNGALCQYFSGHPIGQGYAPKNMPGPLYIIPPGQLPRNQWVEVIYHVYWTPDANGVIEGWWKRATDPTYTKTLSIGPPGQGYAVSANFPTQQMGTNDSGDNVTTGELAGNDLSIKDSEDKFGQYGTNYISDGGLADSWFDNWCRATSLEAAATC